MTGNMDKNEFQALWAQHEAKLERNWALNLAVLRQINLDKVKNKLQALLWVKGLALFFYMLIAINLLNYAWEHQAVHSLGISGLVLAVWALAVALATWHELVLVSKIDYAEPIIALQKKLVRVKLAIIKYIRLGVWVLPLHFAMVVLFFDIWWEVDIVAEGNPTWIKGQVAFTLLFMLPLAILLHLKVNPKNADKPWMHWLLKGNGSQILEALQFLKVIKDFEQGEDNNDPTV